MAVAEREITFSDIQQTAERRDPQLAELVIRFLEQPDPLPGEPEEPPEGEDAAPGAPTEKKPAPEDAWTLPRLRRAMSPAAMMNKTATEKKLARREAWEGILAAQNPPPRLLLAKLLIDLYEAGDEPARSALMEIIVSARIAWGPWQAMKQIYKLAEANHDALIFGALAYRFDATRATELTSGEVSPATFVYLRRRAWRWLRQLGRALPELYPQFAAQVLSHYPRDFSFQGSWIANQIWGHKDLVGRGRAGMSGPPRELEARAFDEAWKTSSEPLLRLLEDAKNDAVAGFAIRALEKDFPDALKRADPRWIARIGKRPLGAVHELLIKILSDSPELHQSKLRALGLHEMVLGLLTSTSPAARKYAIEYARTHAQDMTVQELVGLAAAGASEVKAFAASLLEARSPQDLGLAVLAELIGIGETSKMAAAKIAQAFSTADVTPEIFIKLSTGAPAQRKFVKQLYANAKAAIPARYWQRLLAAPSIDGAAQWEAINALGAYPGSEIGADWIKEALFDPRLQSHVERWLRAGTFTGADLDVDWVKSLVMRPRTRALAIELLSNPKLLSPQQVGLGWLLAMARHADDVLHVFAHRYLLEHFTPVDFARDSGGGGVEDGVERLWALATGKNEPEAVRRFAGTYLRAHHPAIAMMKNQGIAPRLPREAYPLERVRPLFSDPRADVRELAAAIGKVELVRWNHPELIYELADSGYKEGRKISAEVLLAVGEPEADPAHVPPPDWLSAPAVFALAESTQKATRELALTLIRRHYGRLGGAQRLAWLMESPDREVRLFAVRLLWEKHRPSDVAPGWKPKKRRPGEDAAPVDGALPVGSLEAGAQLQHFLRSTMFGLPPGRMERRELSDKEALPDRALAASVAKRRLVEVVRDLSIEDSDFAKLAVPILEEFTSSTAKGEWQSCVAALARIRAAHSTA